MQPHPFALLRPFSDKLDVALLTKEDGVRTDEDVRRVTGVQNVASLHQMHSDTCVVVREPTSRTIQADGMITDVPGLTLSIRMADCQTFVVYEPRKHVVGVMHVGWKCLKAGMIRSFFKTLKMEFNVDARDTLIGGGPSLCMACASFSDPIRELEGTEGLIVKDGCADLIGIANIQLGRCGADPERIERVGGCTRCHPETLWTYRGGDREKVKEGWTNVLCASII